jgi:protein-disulfide isomerase
MSNAGYTLMNEKVQNDKTKAGDVANFLSGIVDVQKMKSCLEDSKWDNVLTADASLATELGAQGTPNFFVNETPFQGAYSYTDMKSVVDAALQ